MIVVAVLGLLSAIALPRFGNMLVRSKESSTKGNLGAFRAAICIYYSDNEGIHPSAAGLPVSLTTGGRYLDAIPPAHIPVPGNHPNTIAVTDFAGAYTDVGDWMYQSTASGTLTVNCTHSDTTSHIWSSW
ncbi:MAG: hypothetical protein IPP35_05780 [Elusimicrobia bacterium]|nr:hypothetical protein [Elusimicrobiota bacterium]